MLACTLLLSHQQVHCNSCRPLVQKEEAGVAREQGNKWVQAQRQVDLCQLCMTHQLPDLARVRHTPMMPDHRLREHPGRCTSGCWTSRCWNKAPKTIQLPEMVLVRQMPMLQTPSCATRAGV